MKRLAALITLLLIHTACAAHENKYVHPFSITGYAWSMLLEQTKTNTLPQSSPYYELVKFFYDAPPSGYVRASGSYEDTLITRTGTLGTIEADEPRRKVCVPFLQSCYLRGRLR
jgi:hypothetical protein